MLKQKMMPSNMNICAKDEHIHIIEGTIRTTKERSWCTTHSVPYTRLPIIMTKSLVQGQVSWLNSLSPINGISDTIIPATIVLGKPTPYFSKTKICFDAYSLAYTKTKNDMTTRVVTATALQEPNRQGGFYFLSLHSGKQIHSFNMKELPIDDDVINRVKELALS